MGTTLLCIHTSSPVHTNHTHTHTHTHTNTQARSGEVKDHPMRRFEDGDEIAPLGPTATREAHARHLPLYSAFLGHVTALVDGSLDVAKFEEFVRNLLGNNCYIVFTLDKVVQQLVKCLTYMASDSTVSRLVGLYMWHRNHGQPPVGCAAGGRSGLSLTGGNGVDPHLYHAHISVMLSQTVLLLLLFFLPHFFFAHVCFHALFFIFCLL
jgi:hypothetical protein